MIGGARVVVGAVAVVVTGVSVVVTPVVAGTVEVDGTVSGVTTALVAEEELSLSLHAATTDVSANNHVGSVDADRAIVDATEAAISMSSGVEVADVVDVVDARPASDPQAASMSASVTTPMFPILAIMSPLLLTIRRC